ncbi:peptide-methionine (S)-S-oxide reductase [Litoreibacter janthinus]|uniref:peptide-methionine (S)-S-oxide reductase n=1 Tax=Litoreibacter janthinus TaxID=670154 RepID=A0A1I6H1J5_9RHOB|nr:peptide-methionine (S)-S-oxide reductase [Litoreibacter janthinus]SFR48356.1 peptide-methionine (S)-S-oxide reductase [Litoreibacter janthinus]
MNQIKIGFGGGCHWCTEAVFQSLRGVSKVEQGFIKSIAPHDGFSEAVVVKFDPDVIPLKVLIDVHLRTHASTSQHKMRGKYRSAVYTYSSDQADCVQRHIKEAQSDFDEPIVTMTLPFDGFKPSLERFQRYYETNPRKPFCTAYIDPKLSKIRRLFGQYSVQE